MTTVPFPVFPGVALLDWDGTFCDSRKGIYDINLEMADFYGKVMPSYEEWLQVSHPGVEACMRSLGVTESRENVNDFFHRLLVEQKESGYQNRLYPHTEEFLVLLQRQKIPAVVISRHLHEHLEKDIEAHGLRYYFSQIIGEPAYSSLKKDEVMRSVCNSMALPYERAFYLGDTSHDMKLAREAGVCALAISHGYDPVSELQKETPAHIFGSLEELIAFLEY